MDNRTETFAYIQILRATAKSSDFYAQGMEENYLLEEPGTMYNKYRAGAEWSEYTPDRINDLAIGAAFIGVSRRDSMARMYTVIAKDKEGKSIWFPMDTNALQVIVINRFDPELNTFKPMFKATIDSIIDKMKANCVPGEYYLSTDLNGFKVPFLAQADNDDDDDELSDDLTPEEQDVLDRLKEELGDDDDDDDTDPDEDEDDEAHSDMDVLTKSIFTCIDVNGEKAFLTVAEGLQLDININDLAAERDLTFERTKRKIQTINKAIEEQTIMHESFEKTYSNFMDKFAGSIVPEDLPELTPLGADESEEHVPSMAKYLPKDEYVGEKDHPVPDTTPTVNTEAEEEVVSASDSDTITPEDYADNEGSTEPFGADDSKWDGPAEYKENSAKSSQDFGDW